jgi:citrate synthase
MRLNSEPIGRPRQIYTGPTERVFTPLDLRWFIIKFHYHIF